MTFRAVTCNAFAPGGRAANVKTVVTAAKRADVLLLQEADGDVYHALETALSSSWAFFQGAGGADRNPIAWRKDVLFLVNSGSAKIYANKAGVKDGPDRFMAWCLFEEIATGEQILVINVHLIHQAWTSHKERQPGWLSSVAELGRVCLELQARFPGVRMLLGGDWNPPKSPVVIPGLDAVEIGSPITYGSFGRYDRWLTVGDFNVDAIEAFDTPSDHHSLLGLVTLAIATQPELPQEVLVTVRKAKAIERLFDEFNTRFPGRGKATDGWLGDAAHRSRQSDHNAWIVDGNDRVVSAADITEDNEGGIKEIVDWAIEVIVKRRDPRIKYIIHEARILRSYDKPGIPAWTWSRYTGPNSHQVHGHFSVRSEKKYYDSDAPWGLLEEESEPKPNKVELARALFKEGIKLLEGVDVKRTHAHIMRARVEAAITEGPKS